MKRLSSIITITILLVLSSVQLTNAQKRTDVYKLQAQKKMLVGRYGEAINLLNKYIAANPQKADGYNLRGLSFEKRKVYEYAVYDFRSARKLQPRSKQINANLARATAAWQSLLYNNIEGYKREIAIDPSVPSNYLNIGKSYKNLGKWGLAEEWYDKYLTMEEASADEIIRYSEILAKNGHIKKGEPILKRYTVKYPKDQRLWSRYGYFVLWLGKNKTAIDAFENALAIRPYFKEALDGLDRAKGKPYLYSINDTTVKYRNGRIVRKKRKRFEYPIDRYYRLLKRRPNDNALRFKLVNALVKVERFVEAEDQLKVLTEHGVEQEKIDVLLSQVTDRKDSIYQIRIEQYTKKIKIDPGNKKLALKLADYYARITDYDSALEILDDYLKIKPLEKNLDIRYMIAKYSAWNYDFDRADEELKTLLKQEPTNLKYQLLRGQVLVWVVRDLDEAKGYLENVLSKEPNNIYAIVSMVALNAWQKDFQESKKFLDIAKNMDPELDIVKSVEQFYVRALSGNESEKIRGIRTEAEKLAMSGDYQAALGKYDEYLQKITAPTKQELISYAYINFAAKNYEKAASIYDQILSKDYDYDIALLKARALLWSSDSAAALGQFKKLVSEQPNNYQANLYLAEAYSKMHEYGDAEDIYKKMLEAPEAPEDSSYIQLDSSQIRTVNARLGWLPVTGFRRLLSTFPSYISLQPGISYFTDNHDFSFNITRFGVQLGITQSLSAGVLYRRTHMQSSLLRTNLTSFEGQLQYRFSKFVTAVLGFGVLESPFGNKRNISEATIRAEKPDEYSIVASLQNTDGRTVLYSPKIIGISNIDVNVFRLNGLYKAKTGVKVSGSYRYVSVSDGNTGNDFQVRVGREFYKNIYIGYEFRYSNYSINTPLYYTPQNYSTHGLWVEWNVKKTKKIELNFGGNLGYAPSVNYILRGLQGEILYKLLQNITLSGIIRANSSYKFNSNYNSLSMLFSVYLTLF